MRTASRIGSPAFIAALVAALALVASRGATTAYRGAFQCTDGRPLAGARVELWQQEVRWLPQVWPNIRLRNVQRADVNGGWGFRISGDESNWFVRVVLVGEDAALRDFPWPWDWYADTLRSQNDRRLRDYGTQRVSGYQCGVWNGISEAGRDYRQQAGSAPPQGVTVVRAGAPTSGVPFTPYDEVWWPSGYPVYRSSGTSTAQHEFAHVVRHVFDGDLGHFLGDSAHFWYLRNHSAASCEPTNSGFAFNEGWAEYWAGQAIAPCPNPNDGRVERNVAASLQLLATSCGLPRARMVAVLAQNRERIHSIDEYTRALNCTPPIKSLGRSKPPTPTVALLRERRALLVEGRKLVSALGRSVTRLRHETVAAMRLAERPLPCPEQPCAEQLERELQPVLLASRLAQARALKEKLGFLANPTALRRLGRVPVARQMRRIEAERSAAVAEAARIAAASLRRARSIAQRLGAGRENLDLLRRAAGATARGKSTALSGMASIAPVRLRTVGPSPSPVPVPVPMPAPSSPPPPLPVPRDLAFTDWTSVSANVATGALQGRSVTLSGSHVWPPPQSELDGRASSRTRRSTRRR